MQNRDFSYAHENAGTAFDEIELKNPLINPGMKGSFETSYEEEINDEYSDFENETGGHEMEWETDQPTSFETDHHEHYADENNYTAEEESETLYEHDVPTPSNAVAAALAKKDWPLALQLAIGEGHREMNDLANIVFFARHPELPKESLSDKHPDFKKLGQEWSSIFNNEVWKAVQAASVRTDLSVTGEEAAEHHRYFWGGSGKKLKALVQAVAKDVNINAGLLGTTMIVESAGRVQNFLLTGKVFSYSVGVDDFYEARDLIKAKVPAYSKAGWDKSQKPEEHFNDAQTKQRKVKSIWFNSGRDAAYAVAVYLKYYETRLREEAIKLKGDFDKLPLETRIALNRIAMGAGMGGAYPYLKNALTGTDIFDRKPKAVVIYQTQRNATVRMAQAMHLAEWVFGTTRPVVKTQPELEDLEHFDGEMEEQFGMEEEIKQTTFATKGASIFMTVTAEKQGAIKGGVVQKGKEGMIAVMNFHHEVVAPRDVVTGQASGKRQHKPIVIIKEIDAASVKLFNALVTNEKLKTVALNFWQQSNTGKELNFYRITLSDVIIAGITQDMQPNPVSVNLPFFERVELVYQKIEWSFLSGGIVATDSFFKSGEVAFESPESFEEEAVDAAYESASDEAEAIENFIPATSQADSRTRLDEYFSKAASEYNLPGGQKIKVLSQFRMTNGVTIKSEDAKVKVKRSLRGKKCAATDSMIHFAAYGRARPEEVAIITQCLIDAGEFANIKAKFPAFSNSQLVRQVQFEFGIGIDCAGYVQLAFAFMALGKDRLSENERDGLGLQRKIGNERLESLPSKHFEKIAINDVQTGDLMVMDPRKNDDGSMHTVIVVDHTSDKGIHNFIVDASWGHLYGDDASGVARRTLVFDSNKKTWKDIHPVTSDPVNENTTGPYNGHTLKGFFRARQLKPKATKEFDEENELQQYAYETESEAAGTEPVMMGGSGMVPEFYDGEE